MEERNGRRYRTQDEWHELLSRWESSGEKGASFAKKEGICASLFYKWQRQLRPKAKSQSGFVEVRAIKSNPQSVYEIVCRNGRVVRVSGVPLNEVLALVETN